MKTNLWLGLGCLAGISIAAWSIFTGLSGQQKDNEKAFLAQRVALATHSIKTGVGVPDRSKMPNPTMMVDQMTKELNLTADQKLKVQKMFADITPKAGAGFDPSKMQEQMQKLDAILTPEQRAKMANVSPAGGPRP